MTDWHLAYYVSIRAFRGLNFSEIQMFDSWIASADAERIALGIPSIFD